jgi:uncharacterized protein YbjT (DUF2867 family)
MKVLLTGSTGYIGRRLEEKLLEDDNISLRLFVRNINTTTKETREKVEIVQGDTFDKEALKKALDRVDIAYYLIHSLNKDNYKDLDKISAQNFLDVAASCGVKKIIYLGGLGIKNKDTSEHLLSRIETGEILSSNNTIQTIWIRAGVIIGSGSASFEIIRNLTQKIPIMTTPKWVNTKAQPIAVNDVLLYLKESLYVELDKSIVVDIGAEQLSYKDMMEQTAFVLGLKRYIIPVPFLSIGLSSYWLNLFTPVPFKVAKALIEGLKSEVIKQNDNARIVFPGIKPIAYKKAVSKAIEQIKQNQVLSRWNDNSGKVWDTIHIKEFSTAVFVDRQEADIKTLNKEKVYNSFLSIGGENGWFAFDILWKIRGFLDKVLGGVGLRRGRRDKKTLRIGDCLDFWKVVDIKENERLLLYAQMILPGEAWLEFMIKDDKLIQSAYFYPKGVLGRIYWYSLMPLHYFVFRNMIVSIVNKSMKNI